MVLALSGIYIQRFLDAGFSHTRATAESLLNELQAAVLDEVRQKASAAALRPGGSAGMRDFMLRTVETDPEVALILQRSLRHWPLLSEIFITDVTGHVRASTLAARRGARSIPAPNLAEWDSRPFVDTLRDIYGSQQNPEMQVPIAIQGEREPVVSIHVVVSSVFLRNALHDGVESVGEVCAACLLVSLALAILLPNVILSPLEHLSRRIDLMTSGEPAGGAPPVIGETKEFAAVYSKLNVLEQRFAGAQQNADQLRGNIQQLLERLEQAVLLFDANGLLTMAGHAVGPLLGRDPATLTGRTASEIFPDSSEIGALLNRSMPGGQEVRDRIVSLHGGERDCPVLVSIQPLGRPDSALLGTLVTLRDAQTRGELAAQLDVASRLSALSQLTRGVAHEIKNPLNAIALHLEVLRSRLEEQAPELDIIEREIQRLDRVVKTFLDFNRPLAPRLETIDLNVLARDIAALIVPDARSRKARVAVRTGDRPVLMNGDPDLLKQAVLNVVMNGLEAMNGGGDLTLESRVKAGNAEFIVSDTGPGIAPEIQDKIFNLYFSTKQHGSGIGLAMTFRLIQLQDGRIDFSSKAGSGSTFCFSFREAASPTQTDLELSHSHLG